MQIAIPANTPAEVHEATIKLIEQRIKQARDISGWSSHSKAIRTKYQGRVEALEELLETLKTAVLVEY